MLLSTTTYLLLPAAVLAAPAPVTEISPRGLAIREAEGVGLANTNVRLNCFIERGNPVNCRKGPGFSYPIVVQFDEGTEHTFSCATTSSSCEPGNCTWDYAVNWRCYVNGYYTDDTCSLANLGHC